MPLDGCASRGSDIAARNLKEYGSLNTDKGYTGVNRPGTNECLLFWLSGSDFSFVQQV